MALTLLDMAALEQKPLKKAVLFSMFQSQLPSPMEQLPIENATSLGQKTVRITDFGSPTTRNLGDAVSAYKATFSDREETLKIIENKITLDKIYLDIKSFIQDPLSLQMKAYSLVVKNTVNNLLINGDPGTDPTQPAGLFYRLQNDATFSGQAVNHAGAAINDTDTHRLAFLNNFDNAVTLCGGGDPDIAIVNRQTWISFRGMLRALKLLDVTRDQFDRMIMTYGRIQIINAGQKPANVLDPTAAGQVLLDNGYTDFFGNATSSILYLLQTKGEDSIKLLQLFPLRMQKIGIDPSDPGQYVVDLTWPVGFALPQRFCVSALSGYNRDS